MRTDLLVVWPVARGGARPHGHQRVVIKCKLLHGGFEATLAKGLRQTRAYMERAGSDEGHLVIFDRTRGATRDERIYCREEKAGDQRITCMGDVKTCRRSRGHAGLPRRERRTEARDSGDTERAGKRAKR